MQKDLTLFDHLPDLEVLLQDKYSKTHSGHKHWHANSEGIMAWIEPVATKYLKTWKRSGLGHQLTMPTATIVITNVARKLCSAQQAQFGIHAVHQGAIKLRHLSMVILNEVSRLIGTERFDSSKKFMAILFWLSNECTPLKC